MTDLLRTEIFRIGILIEGSSDGNFCGPLRFIGQQASLRRRVSDRSTATLPRTVEHSTSFFLPTPVTVTVGLLRSSFHLPGLLYSHSVLTIGKLSLAVGVLSLYCILHEYMRHVSTWILGMYSTCRDPSCSFHQTRG